MEAIEDQHDVSGYRSRKYRAPPIPRCPRTHTLTPRTGSAPRHLSGPHGDDRTALQVQGLRQVPASSVDADLLDGHPLQIQEPQIVELVLQLRLQGHLDELSA